MGRIRSGVYGALLIGAALGLLGCDSRPEPVVGDDEIARASYLIEQKQYSEAIYILSERTRHYPNDKRARVILASAYAARAGISLSSYVNFARELAKWGKVDQILPEENDGDFLQSIAKASVRVQLMYRAFDSIPAPSSLAAMEDIQKAYTALVEAGELSGGPSLYRALVRIMVFKQDLFLKNRPRIERGCMAYPKEISKWLKSFLISLEAIFIDVGNGFTEPELRKKADEMTTKFREIISDIDPAKMYLEISNEPVALPPALKMLLGQCR